VRAAVRILRRQDLCAPRARPNATWKDHEVRLTRRWPVHGTRLRGAGDGPTSLRHPGMLLLDPKAPGPLLRRRLRVGNRRRGKGGGVVREVAVAAPLYAGRAGVSLLCRAVSRRSVRAYGPRPVRKASRSTREARARAPGLGGELSAELR